MKLLTYSFISISLWLFILSCARSRSSEFVQSFTGQELKFPDGLTFQIQSDTIEYDLDDADFTIVTYLDSTGCTSCRMKLHEWNHVINEFKALPNLDVNFVMILHSTKPKEINYLLKKDSFLHPVSFDYNNDFAKLNQLPKEYEYHTFLLDSNKEVVLIGNPVLNPKVLDLYQKVIMDGLSIENQAVSVPIGALQVGETSTTQIKIHNQCGHQHTLQAIVPSCECISACMNKDSVSPDETTMLEINYVADSVLGQLPTLILQHSSVDFMRKRLVMVVTAIIITPFCQSNMQRL